MKGWKLLVLHPCVLENHYTRIHSAFSLCWRPRTLPALPAPSLQQETRSGRNLSLFLCVLVFDKADLLRWHLAHAFLNTVKNLSPWTSQAGAERCAWSFSFAWCCFSAFSQLSEPVRSLCQGWAVASQPPSPQAEQHCWALLGKQQGSLSSQGHSPTHGFSASLLWCWCAKLFMFPACQELSTCPHGL